jgi:hypothetical protein
MRKRFAVLLAGLFVMTSVVLSAAPANATVWWLQYSDRSARLCMDVPGGSTAELVFIQQTTCKTPVGSGSYNQTFQIQTLGNGNKWVIARNSNKCVQIWNESSTDGTGIQQLTCSSSLGQQWQTPVVSENPNGSVNILFRNVLSGKCITANGNGAVLTQQTCDTANLRHVWRQHLRDSGGNQR